MILGNKHLYLDYENRSLFSFIKYKIKYILLKILFIIDLLLFNHKKNEEKKYKVSICAIFKNEAKYLKEWIEYHKIIGVDHFYLYNNFSDDNYLEILQKYIDEGIVTLIEWPVKQGQIAAYKDCIIKYKIETNWIGFIDIDEFVVPKKENNINDFLNKYKKIPSVLIYWKVFGTSGLKERDENSLVVESFTVCWDKYYCVGKCFYNTNYKIDLEYIGNSLLHHKLFCKIGFFNIPPVNVFKKFCLFGIYPFKKGDPEIQINHYFTKSYQEYIEKASKGDVYFENNPHNLDYFYEHEIRCKNTDYSIFRFLINLKNNMN